MATPKKSSSNAVKAVKVRDLDTKKDAKGGAHHHGSSEPRGVRNHPVP